MVSGVFVWLDQGSGAFPLVSAAEFPEAAYLLQLPLRFFGVLCVALSEPQAGPFLSARQYSWIIRVRIANYF